MRYIFTFIYIILFFTACQNNQVETPMLKSYNSFDKFDYKKESINFFEKEFKRFLDIENIDILNQSLNFYKTNSNYFINGKQKVKELENRIKKLEDSNNINLELEQLKLAKDMSPIEAIKIYKKLAKKGNIKAQRELVNIYKYKNPKESLKWLEKLVVSGDIYSMKEFASANIYMNRPVLVQDLKKAIETYEKLVKLGELSSIMRLGNIYEYGYHKQVAPQNKQKALEYYELAASKNYEIAQKKLHEIYSCKDCKPNRYNPKKAQKLQALLLKNLDNKILQDLNTKEKKLTKIDVSPKIKKIIKPKKITSNIKKSKIIVKPKEVVKAIKKPKILANVNKIVLKTEKNSKRNIRQKEIIKKPKIITKTFIHKKEKNNSNKKSKKELGVIKCYDSKVASEVISENCKNMIQTFIQNSKNIRSIRLIPVLDKSDIEYYSSNNEELKKSKLYSLGEKRALVVEKYLQNTMQKTPIIRPYTYYVVSKKSNKGVIIKFY